MSPGSSSRPVPAASRAAANRRTTATDASYGQTWPAPGAHPGPTHSPRGTGRTDPDAARRYRSALVATEKRERQRTNRQLKQEAQVKEHRRATTKRRVVTYGLGMLALFAAVIGLAALGGAFSGDDDETTLDPITSSTTPSVGDSIAPVAEPGTTFAGIEGETPCPEADGSSEPNRFVLRGAADVHRPRGHLHRRGRHQRRRPDHRTRRRGGPEHGEQLRRARSLSLLRRHPVPPGDHRLHGPVRRSDRHAGRATRATSSTTRTRPSNEDYTLGAVAMANSGPDTNGSQFFITTSDSSPSLETNYSLFGQVTDGLDTTLTASTRSGRIPTPTTACRPANRSSSSR